MKDAMNKTKLAAVVAVALVGCATPLPPPAELDRMTLDVIRASFRERGIAKMDRIEQDLGQKACSSDSAPPADVAKQIEAQSLAAVRWPSDGRFLGDWREGEKLAQSGRGMTWSDSPGVPNGANCYNCHQISKAEISHGTIGPSLYHYGKVRGVADPASPQAQEVLRYTWAKIYNAKAYNACSGMPRFGHAGVLTEDQIRHVMALLLDPKSPVNAQ
jgi:sulfur-oxidizing protein SoxX